MRSQCACLLPPCLGQTPGTQHRCSTAAVAMFLAPLPARLSQAPGDQMSCMGVPWLMLLLMVRTSCAHLCLSCRQSMHDLTCRMRRCLHGRASVDAPAAGAYQPCSPSPLMQATLKQELTCPMCRCPWGPFSWRPPPAGQPTPCKQAAHHGKCCRACHQVKRLCSRRLTTPWCTLQGLLLACTALPATR